MKNLFRLCGAVVTAMVLYLALSSTAVFSSAGSAPALAGTTITVNSTSDAAANDGLCTLREAITSANMDTASGAARASLASPTRPTPTPLRPLTSARSRRTRPSRISPTRR